jgi:hypothetical protein
MIFGYVLNPGCALEWVRAEVSEEVSLLVPFKKTQVLLHVKCYTSYEMSLTCP